MFEQLTRDCVKREPFIWVRRLAVLKQCDLTPIFVRDIPLARGLNVIWAEEPSEEEVIAPIAGHSAGKTTFCRFLRYVLGESTYATKRNLPLIREAFPYGYVAAELYVDGRLWAVRRPIGNGRNSYIAEGVTIEELLESGGQHVSQDNYTERIGIEALMDRFPTGGIARSGDPIQWGHVLAWMTRDQEARFQSIYDWRSTKSTSQWPTLRYPRADALFVMRAVLGLFRPEELSGEQKLTELCKERDQLERDVEEKRREPQYRANLRITQLRKALKSEFKNDDAIDSLEVHTGDMLPDLLTRATDAVSEIEHRIERLVSEETEVQTNIDSKNAELNSAKEKRENLQAALEQAKELGKQGGQDQATRLRQQQLVEDNGDIPCEFAWVKVNECSHVKNLLSQLDDSSVKDAHELEQLEALADQQCRKIQQHLNTTALLISTLTGQLPGLNEKRTKNQQAQAREKASKKQIEELRDALELWVDAPVSEEEFKELCETEASLISKRSDVENQEKLLSELLEGHQTNRDLLTKIFSMCVRSVIRAPDYDGAVDFSDRELQFQLMHGTSMNGEAVETLAILLADISSVLFNSLSRDANLPGILVHDSPREADLGLRLYHAFINFVAELELQFGGADQCPFQYILTTTTSPPKTLRIPPHRKALLSAHDENELFLRCNISAVTPATIEPDLDLFAVEDEEG